MVMPSLRSRKPRDSGARNWVRSHLVRRAAPVPSSAMGQRYCAWRGKLAIGQSFASRQHRTFISGL
jgi:hypothetical protein